MTRASLRLRLLAVQGLAVALALACTGAGLVYLFERHVERRVGTELDTYLVQLAARVAFDPDGMPIVENGLVDPRFESVFSGLYWQIDNVTAAAVARSRSLWDTSLAVPAEPPGPGATRVDDAEGPQGQSLLLHERRLFYPREAGEYDVRLAVAVDRAGLDALTADFGWDVSMALGALALLLIAAAWAQVSVGLKPLASIRTGVAAIRDGRRARLDGDVPTEVSPLVDEVNALLEAQERSLQRARGRAADLAHGFKTPLTALVSDVQRLRRGGETEIADDIEQISLIMRRQIDREMARARERDRRALAAVPVEPIVGSIVHTLKRTPQGECCTFDTRVEDGLAVMIEADDLSEILGNLLENAVRHANGTVAVRATRAGGIARFDVEDDGPGIADALRATVVERGNRLDRSGSGAGLGLAIVRDVLEFYDADLTLDRSSLGGAKASFSLPAAPQD